MSKSKSKRKVVAKSRSSRGNYNSVSNQDRNRLIDYFLAEDNDGNYLKFADIIGIKRQTARSIIARFMLNGQREKKPKGGARHVKVDDEMKATLFEIVKENSEYSMQQINEQLRQRRPDKMVVAERTLARALDDMLIVSLRNIAADGNRGTATLESEEQLVEGCASMGGEERTCDAGTIEGGEQLAEPGRIGGAGEQKTTQHITCGATVKCGEQLAASFECKREQLEEGDAAMEYGDQVEEEGKVIVKEEAIDVN